jgi:hypothetical protein
MRRVYFAIKLNAFNVKPAGAASRAHASGLFPTLALFNHSCEPNCGIQYQERNVIRIVALRDICKGEELTIAYTNPFVNRKERRRVLKERFFFDCACKICSGEAEESDNVRALLQTALDHACSLDQRLASLKLLEASSASQAAKTEAANDILNAAMTARAAGGLGGTILEAVLDLFLDPASGVPRLVATVSPDTYWQWLIFFVDGSKQLGCADLGRANLDRGKLGQKTAQHGVHVLTLLYGDTTKLPPPIEPYFNYLVQNAGK